jgi:ABC-type branched-subunit amino acid transport system permease subunit
MPADPGGGMPRFARRGYLAPGAIPAPVLAGLADDAGGQDSAIIAPGASQPLVLFPDAHAARHGQWVAATQAMIIAAILALAAAAMALRARALQPATAPR